MMITHQAIKGMYNATLIQTSGYGKTYTKPLKGTDIELIRWQQWAEARIVEEKLEGFVKARAIAYEAKAYVDPVTRNYVRLLLGYFVAVKGRGNMVLYKMVVAHKNKLMAILPYKENVMNVYVPEIIAFCEEKVKGEN